MRPCGCEKQDGGEILICASHAPMVLSISESINQVKPGVDEASVLALDRILESGVDRVWVVFTGSPDLLKALGFDEADL